MSGIYLIFLELVRLHRKCVSGTDCSNWTLSPKLLTHAFLEHRVLVALALGSLLHTSGASESHEQALRRHNTWSVHPLGQGIVSEILKRFMHTGDLQTVAVLSCVLHDAEAEVEAESLRFSGPQKLTQAVRFRILPHELRQQCDNFTKEYAMLLRCRGLTLLSATVRARRWRSAVDTDDALEGGRTRGERPRVFADESSGPGTIGRPVPRAPTCGVCNLPVRGLGNTCFACGHIGHLNCLRSWFTDAGMSSCPAGCGCQCCHHIIT